MANEASIVTDSQVDGHSYTVAAGTAIAKGEVLNLTDERTAIKATSGAGTTAVLPAAGVASTAKDATDDTSTTLGTLGTGTIVNLSASGAITLGAAVCAVADNHVAEVPATCVVASGAIVLGECLGTATDAEVVQIKLK